MRNYSTLPEADLEELLLCSAFEEAAAQLAATMPDKLFDERIAHDLRPLSAAEIQGPVLYLPLLFPELVLTSNLDQILEMIYEAAGKTFGHVLLGPEIHRLSVLTAPTESFLLKLHGDCASSEHRVLGLEEYEKAYADGAGVTEALATVFRTFGTSSSLDAAYNQIDQLNSSPEWRIPAYLCLHTMRFLRNHPPRVKSWYEGAFLAQRGIFPIWYANDHNDCIEALLVGVLKHVGRLHRPPEEASLNRLTESEVESSALASLRPSATLSCMAPQSSLENRRGACDPDYRDVVLERRLREALARLNPDLPPRRSRTPSAS